MDTIRSVFGINVKTKNTMIEATEVRSDVDAEDSPRAPEIFSCPPGLKLAREPWQTEQFEKKPKVWTAISEEPDEKQIPQAQTTIAQPMPQCHTRDSGTFGGESGQLFKIEKTFIEVNNDNEQAESAPKIMSAPAQSSALDEFQEQEYQKSLLNPPPVQESFPEKTPIHENDGLHPAFHRQDLTLKIDALIVQLRQLQNLPSPQHIINAHNGMRDMCTLLEKVGWMDHGCKPQELDHGGSAMSAAMPLPELQQQQYQQQVQQPQPQQLLDYDYWDAPSGKHFRDPSTNSILAFIRVAKSKANSRRRRKLMENVLFVGPKGNFHDRGALKMWVDVPHRTENLKCDQAMLHLDGNAFDGLGGCTRYNIMMYVGEAMLSGTEWGSDLGDGWHEYGINEFGGNQKRPVCMLRDIKMGRLLAGSSPFIYLGMRLVPVP